ncbi:TetR/AcrR family transcriptional regulator C-terminal domain-containing protein [Streptomyces sp. NPDC058642]|uniref:TetR/AcrR family transcriptional regulator C-terminal domain-containing protein n=1 Tax=Streptomyces sp. NPDC058642 TaxID=3346572 RepID=UPI0036517CA1
MRRCDPEQAADTFFALLTDTLESPSRLGTCCIPAAELRVIADAAVDVFLRASGSD